MQNQDHEEPPRSMIGTWKRPPAMVTVNFKMPGPEYEALKAYFQEIGLTPGAGLRFALAEFMRNRKGDKRK